MKRVLIRNIILVSLFFGNIEISQAQNQHKALLRAVDKGDKAKVEELIKAGADVNAQDKND